MTRETCAALARVAVVVALAGLALLAAMTATE